jgi:dihydrofolate synthase/folylpolyglutamate synthase
LNTPYPESVRFLYALGNEFKTIKLGLERIRTLLDALGRPHQACRFVHVAGTNGKGSTCALIERALREAGIRTGLYTSPHLVEPTERIQVAGRPVSAEEFAAAFDRVHSTAERLVHEAAIDMHPTYFETITAMAFALFRDLNAEMVVLETGMGGRLDGTNVVNPELSVITPVDFDHEQYLGDTIPKIASEKAGIIKPGRPVVIARQRPEAQAVLERRAREQAAPPIRATDWVAQDLHLDAFGSHFVAEGPAQIAVQCPLVGAHQVDNTLTAVAALHHLGMSDDSIRSGIAATRWPGRLELVRRRPDLLLDGAHNPAGALALAEYIREFHHDRKVWMVFGAMRDKDISVIGPLLFPLASELIFTGVRQTRAFAPAELREISGETRARLASTSEEAMAMAAEAAPEDIVFVTGSLYLVGEVRAKLMP